MTPITTAVIITLLFALYGAVLYFVTRPRPSRPAEAAASAIYGLVIGTSIGLIVSYLLHNLWRLFQ